MRASPWRHRKLTGPQRQDPLSFLVVQDVAHAGQERSVPDRRQSAAGQRVGLAGDDGQAYTRVAESCRGFVHSGVGLQQPVVMGVGISAVGVHHLRRVVVVARVLAELGSQRRAESGPPDRFVRHRPEVPPHRMPERCHDEQRRIDERTVEVKQEGTEPSPGEHGVLYQRAILPAPAAVLHPLLVLCGRLHDLLRTIAVQQPAQPHTEPTVLPVAFNQGVAGSISFPG